MQTYGEYAPTGLDHKGAFLPDQQDWLVAPVGQTRDSGCLDKSNFRVVLKDLGDESETVEVHRFGHWACGWFEIIIVKPGTPQADSVEEWERALADYPVADESDYSELEWETACEYWERMGLRERAEWCERSDVSIFAARRDDIPEDPSGELISRLAE